MLAVVQAINFTPLRSQKSFLGSPWPIWQPMLSATAYAALPAQPVFSIPEMPSPGVHEEKRSWGESPQTIVSSAPFRSGWLMCFLSPYPYVLVLRLLPVSSSFQEPCLSSQVS